MRKILFRGKRIDGRGWVRGYYIECNGPCILDDDEMFFGREDGVEGMYEVDPATVGEYTGLRDRNGVMIFEGDILRFSGLSGKTELCVVGYGDFKPFGRTSRSVGFFVYWESDLEQRQKYANLPFWLEESGAVWVGNIHDNPELIRRNN